MRGWGEVKTQAGKVADSVFQKRCAVFVLTFEIKTKKIIQNK